MTGLTPIERMIDIVTGYTGPPAATEHREETAVIVEVCEALVGWRNDANLPGNFVRMVKAADALVALGWTDGSGVDE